jgi:uncharacterized protein
MYYNGFGVPQDYHKAMEFFSNLPIKEMQMLKTALVFTHFYQITFEQLLILICTGELYYYGQGVPQDYHKAMEFYLKSANQGNAVAQKNIGIYSFYSNLILIPSF